MKQMMFGDAKYDKTLAPMAYQTSLLKKTVIVNVISTHGLPKKSLRLIENVLCSLE